MTKTLLILMVTLIVLAILLSSVTKLQNTIYPKNDLISDNKHLANEQGKKLNDKLRI